MINIIEKICVPLSKRYLLVCMCMMGLALTTMNRLIFSVLIRGMIYSARKGKRDTACPPVRRGHDHGGVGMEEFKWGTQLQLLIMTGWVTGYCLGRLPTGLAIERFGAKTLFGYSVFIPAVCNILTPICARTSPYVILANRIIMGIFASAGFPAVAWFAARWFPPRQMGLMLSLVIVGNPIGCIAKDYLVNIVRHTFQNWVSLYYVSGIVTLIWSYLWQAFIWDDPFDHPYISARELEMLADKIPMYANDAELEPGWSWPWKSILTSVSLWSLSMAHLGYSWVYNFGIALIPLRYFPEVHRFIFGQHKELASLVFLIMILTMIGAGKVSDTIIKKKAFNITHISKSYYFISSILGSMMFLGITHSGCNITTINIYYLASVALLAVAFVSHAHASVNIAPNYAATVLALTSMPGLATTPLQIILQDELTLKGTLNEWKTVSYMNAAVCIFATAIFLKVGKCSLRPWNHPKGKKTRDIDYEEIEKIRPRPSSSNVDDMKLSEIPTDKEDKEETQEHPVELAQSQSQRRVSQIKSSRSLNRMKNNRPSVMGDVENVSQTPTSKMEYADSKASRLSTERDIPQNEEGKEIRKSSRLSPERDIPQNEEGKEIRKSSRLFPERDILQNEEGKEIRKSRTYENTE